MTSGRATGVMRYGQVASHLWGMKLFPMHCLLFALPLMANAQSDTLRVHVRHSGCDASVTLGEMRAFALHSATVASHDGVEAIYEGAWLKDVLQVNCPSIAAIGKRAMVRSAVRIEARDGYSALVALTEADSSFRARPVILAWKKNGLPLDDHDGPFQLIVPDDMRHARDVRQVSGLEVVTH